MKNKEFYRDKLVDMAVSGERVAKVGNELVSCYTVSCNDCEWDASRLDCGELRSMWAEEEYVEPENNPFDIKPKDVFYYVDYDGNVEHSYFRANSTFDIQTLKFGNACRDEEYMKKRAKEICLYNLLSNFAYQVNDGWKPNWNDDCENKWFVRFNYLSSKWGPAYIISMRYPDMVYFKTKELAQRAIDEIVIPFERGEL